MDKLKISKKQLKCYCTSSEKYVIFQLLDKFLWIVTLRSILNLSHILNALVTMLISITFRFIKLLLFISFNVFYHLSRITSFRYFLFRNIPFMLTTISSHLGNGNEMQQTRTLRKMKLKNSHNKLMCF